MLAVVLPRHPQARLLEEFQTACRPAAAVRHDVGQHAQALGVLQKSADPFLIGLGHERNGVVDIGAVAQNPFDVPVGERVQPQYGQTVVRRHPDETGPIVRAEPVRLAARQPEGRPVQGVQPPPDRVEGPSRVAATGPHLVESVDEQGLPAPLRMGGGIERQEIARGDEAGRRSERAALGRERRALAGSGVAEQHVGRRRPEVREGSGDRVAAPVDRAVGTPGFAVTLSNSTMARRARSLPRGGATGLAVPQPNLGAGTRNDAAHASSNH